MLIKLPDGARSITGLTLRTDARVETQGSDARVPLRIGLSLPYLIEATAALDLSPSDALELHFGAATEPVLATSPARPGREIYTMPMRMPQEGEAA